MRRAQLTAAPLAARWGLDVVTDPGFTEIPSPDGVPVNDRVGWLRRAMRGTWADLGPRYTRYRDEVVAAAVAVETDSVIVSHFVSINVVIGACLGDDRLVIASLDNGSATIIDHDEHGFRLIESGHEADTLIR
jgi:broad specificity phosphatase PhoE